MRSVVFSACWLAAASACEADGGTPEAFLALVRSATPKWAEVVKRSGAKVD